jgi:tRNA modification GTPase
VCVQTKADDLKRGVLTKNKEIKVSAKNNVGINKLLTYLLTLITNNIEFETYQNIVVCNERQFNLIEKANKTISIILLDLERGHSMDMVASGCRDFVEIIEELLGKITSTDVLNNIFKSFCVGK